MSTVPAWSLQSDRLSLYVSRRRDASQILHESARMPASLPVQSTPQYGYLADATCTPATSDSHLATRCADTYLNEISAREPSRLGRPWKFR